MTCLTLFLEDGRDVPGEGDLPVGRFGEGGRRGERDKGSRPENDFPNPHGPPNPTMEVCVWHGPAPFQGDTRDRLRHSTANTDHPAGYH